MLIPIIALSLAGAMCLFYIILTRSYKNYLNKHFLKKAEEEREKSLDQLLDKYVVAEKKDVVKDKLDKISAIIKATEKDIEVAVTKKVKAAEAQIKAKGKELDVITKAREEYVSHTAGLRSAMPETEEERVADLSELKNVISMLESFDEEAYRTGPKKVDAGVGMFYDTMSRRFKKIFNEQKLNENKFIPIQRLKYHVFQNIKNIKNGDILPILNVMKDTNLLKDIIEINPQFHLIVFTEEKLKFNLKEGVVLTFAFDEDFLTTKKLLELTKWKKLQMERILEDIKKRGIIKIIDENITAEGFGHAEERKKWNEVIDAQIKEEKEKEEEKQKKQLERAARLRKTLATVDSDKAVPKKEEPVIEEKLSTQQVIDSLDDINPVDEEPVKKEFKSKPSIKTLPLPKKAPSTPVPAVKKAPSTPVPAVKKVAPKEVQPKKEEEDLLSVIDALDDLMPEEISKEKKPSSKAPSKEVSMDLGDLGEGDRDLEDLVPEKILGFHEKYSLVNGGFVQFELIRDHVRNELKSKGEVSEDLIKGMLFQLKELQMIQDIVQIGNKEFYMFNKIMLSPVNKQFIEYIIEKPPLTKEELMKGLDWPENRVEAAIKYMEKKEILKVENDKVIIPGVVQKKL